MKVAHIIINFLGYFEQPHSYVKAATTTSWVIFWKHLATS